MFLSQRELASSRQCYLSWSHLFILLSGSFTCQGASSEVSLTSVKNHLSTTSVKYHSQQVSVIVKPWWITESCQPGDATPRVPPSKAQLWIMAIPSQARSWICLESVLSVRTIVHDVSVCMQKKERYSENDSATTRRTLEKSMNIKIVNPWDIFIFISMWLL